MGILVYITSTRRTAATPAILRSLSGDRELRYDYTTMARKFRLGIVLAAMGFGAIAALGAPPANAGALGKPVFFDSAVFPPTPFKVKRAEEQGVELEPTPALPIWGHLSMPKSDGPFPAVVLLHGCGGIGRANEVWTALLVDWGYVVLNVDSFGPRGLPDCFGSTRPPGPLIRALDAHGAKSYLTSLPFVDPEHIAVIGGSHGGATAMQTIHQPTTAKLGAEPFRAAVALYPYCDPLVMPEAPLLILIGELDTWTPANLCERFMMMGGAGRDVVLKIYPGTHHAFNLKGNDWRKFGHIGRYNAEAAEDAIERIRVFLAEHLK